MRALYTAATGMMAQELNVEVISNNIANMRTTGFKKQRAEFQDLMYQNLRRVGTTTSDQGTRLPAGLDIGGGVKVVSTPRVMNQGNISMTEKDLDLAIRGEGFVRVTLPDGRTAYTRAGSFERDDQGRIVTPEGYLLDPQLTSPANATGVTINQSGQVSVTIFGQTQPGDCRVHRAARRSRNAHGDRACSGELGHAARRTPYRSRNRRGATDQIGRAHV